MLLDLLNKNDSLKLSVLIVLESSANTVSIKQLTEKLQISEYHVNTAIDNLISDVSRLNLPVDLFTIKILDHNIVQYQRHSVLSAFNYLLYIYSLESSFRPFFDNFLYEKFTSQIEFLDNNFLSKTSFFRLRKQFDQSLCTFNLQITAKVQLNGSERDIRGFLYIYLLTSCGDVKVPFSPALESDLDELVFSVQNALSKDFSNSTKIKLRYYFYVMFIRCNLGHYYANHDSYKKSQTPFIERISTILTNYLSISSREAHVSAEELLLFLCSEGIIDSVQTEVELLPAIAAIREYFTIYFKTNNKIVNSIFTPEVNLKLYQYLTHIKYFNYPVNLLVNPENSSYLSDNFQEYHLFSQKVIELLKKYYPGRKNLLSSQHEALSIDLLLIIITSFNLSTLIHPIIISIDFTYGETYTKFIENEIQKFNSLNIRVTHQLTEKTDILISNLSPPISSSVNKLQWTTPPTATDWAFLGNLIVSIKKERHFKHGSSK